MRILSTLLILPVLFAPASVARAQDHAGHDHGAHAAQQSAQEETHICPMHPHVTGKKGETCPICGMDLVPKAAGSAPPQQGHDHAQQSGAPEEKAKTANALQIDPAFVQALGVEIGEATHRNFGAQIRAFARIAPRTQGEYAVSARAGGLVSTLEISAVGQKVKKGDILFTLYSRELVVAQQDYLARGAASGAHRLRILGMDDAAIAKLDAEKKILYEVPFHAPTDGIVSALDIRKGLSVEEGQSLIVIHDLSSVWAQAALPARDLARLEKGGLAEIEVGGGALPRPGRVEFVAPEIDEETRTGLVRVLLCNADDSLRPGQYVDAVFEVGTRERLAVPSQAVLRDGRGARVIKALGDGRFEAAAVKTGVESDGYVEILSGLAHGDKIVTSGQFLIDAESTLRGGTDRMRESEGAKAGGGGHVH